ncbi:MAG: mycothiol conjugate amidase Mca [Actinobacteria bacterium]|nr:mycothiol conjugate amidase Mca [Actinomycetota bacterium]
MTDALRLMAVHAHPDDESSKGAAMMAKYVRAGVQVQVVTCTGGERGDLLNPSFSLAGRDIREVRRDEMARAAEILGVDHVWLGFEDSGFPDPEVEEPLPAGSFADLPLQVAAAPLVEQIREFRPHVITTYDEIGGYPHPDHVRTHEISAYAFEAAADASVGHAEPWAALKLYYDITFHLERLTRLHEAMLGAGGESPYGEWIESWGDRPPKSDRVTTRVECADFFELREAALKAHATQVDPEGRWFAVPRQVHAQVWPTEDFELAAARIPVSLPEDDLFAGIAPGVTPGETVWRAPRRSEES